MRIGFFSDVHANLEALTAVLEDASSENVEKLFFLGDAVGYGPNPNECLELIDSHSSACLMGNHDYGAIKLMDTSSFNRYAREAMSYTRTALNKQSKEILLKFEREHFYMDFHMVHSTPLRPSQWKYMVTLADAEENFPHVKRQICLIGHSHYPVIVSKRTAEKPVLIHKESVNLCKDKKFIINTGSVGQPRDGNPDSCYLLFDSGNRNARLKRVAYDIKATQEKMEKAGLPEYLITRLEKGK